MHRALVLLLACLFVSACSTTPTDPPDRDAGGGETDTDGGLPVDGGDGTPDAGNGTPDGGGGVPDAGPPAPWARRAGGTSSEEGDSVAALADGSALVSGTFSGSATFGDTTLTSPGGIDGFLARYNADGSLAWARNVGGTGNDFIQAVAALADGSALVTGSFERTATFGGTSLTSVGNSDFFLAKYNPDGSLAWARRAGGVSNEGGQGIAVLADGTALVTGSFSGTSTFGDITLSATGPTDFFLVKFAPDGTARWARRGGGTGLSNGTSGMAVAALADGSALAVGYFGASATFETTPLTGAGAQDIFLVKYDANGNLVWARRAGGTGGDLAYGVATLADGSALVTGKFSPGASFDGTVPASVGNDDAFLARYTPAGTLAWVRSVGGSADDTGRAVTLLEDGSAVMTGAFVFSANLGGGITLQSTGGSFDVFLVRYDAQGGVVWARSAGGLDTDFGNGVAATIGGSVLVTGRFEGTATFGGTTLTSAGGRDVFVMRLAP